MVQTTQARNRNYGRVRCRFLLDWPSVWRVLFQGIVNAVFMMVVHVIADDPAQMFFVQRNDMVNDLAPATSNPPLGNAILPRRLDTRALRLQARCLQESNHVRIELRVSI